MGQRERRSNLVARYVHSYETPTARPAACNGVAICMHLIDLSRASIRVGVLPALTGSGIRVNSRIRSTVRYVPEVQNSLILKSRARFRGVLSGQGSLNKLPRRVCLLLVPQAHKRHARYSRSSELVQVGSLEVLLSLPR